MKVLISGHRLFKLQNYDLNWIKNSIDEIIQLIPIGVGLSGMASGVDLWFCESCLKYKIPYIACPPFEEQKNTMEIDEQLDREFYLQNASKIWNIRNSQMINNADTAIIVFDGNKGGTHNVFQQLLEKELPIIWLNPISKKIWELK